MKRQILTVVLALVLVLSLVAMIACETECKHNYVDGVCTECGAEDPNAKKDDEGGNNTTGDLPSDIPQTKAVTYVFKLADGNAAIPTYVSPYLTGTTVTDPGFATGTAALELKPLGETGWYYVESELAPNPEAEGDNAWNEYQLVLGYNATSGLGDADCGLKWNDSLKSNECLEYAYPTNPAFEYTAGQKVVNLGTHTFATIPSAPNKVSTTLVVKFDNALPEAATVIIMGGINGWGNDSFNEDGSLKDGEEAKLVMVPNTERTEYSIAVADIVTAEYEFKIVVHGKGWDKKDGTRWGGVEYAGADGANGKVEITLIDDGETIELFDGVAQAYSESTDVNTKLVAKFASALPEGATVAIFGSMNGWGNSSFENGMLKDGEAAKIILTPNDDRTEYSIEMTLETIEYNFKLVVYGKGWTGVESERWGSGGTQYGGEDGTGKTDAKVTPAEGSVELFGGAQLQFSLSEAHDGDIVVTVNFASALAEGSHVALMGIITWDYNKAQCLMTLNDERTSATITISGLENKNYECKFVIVDSTFDVEGTNIWVDDRTEIGLNGGNIPVAITADTTSFVANVDAEYKLIVDAAE